MRIVDFVMILPIMLIIIVIVSIVPRYNVWTFIWVMSAFTGSEKQGSSEVRPFQKAVATMLVHRKLGTNDFVIMFREIMPNLAHWSSPT